MSDQYDDSDLLDDMIRVLGRKGPLTPKQLAKEVGRSEEAVLEHLTQSYYFQAAFGTGPHGRYELNSKGIEQFDKIS